MLVASKPYIIDGDHDTGAPIQGPYSTIQVVDVTDVNVDDVCARVGPYLHTKFDQVTELVWSSGRVHAKLLDALSEAIGAHVIRANFYGASGFSDSHIDTIARRMPNLSYLSIDVGVVDGMFTREGVLRWGKSIDPRRFLRSLASCQLPHLREVTMNNAATFTDDEIRQIVKALPALQTLRLERAQIGTALAAVPPESFEAKELEKKTNTIVFKSIPRDEWLRVYDPTHDCVAPTASAPLEDEAMPSVRDLIKLVLQRK